MKLSYAQNLEDYHLARVFEGQATGTYIDIGGGHPVADNVSFWFYLQGWRGLIVEPQARLASLYAHIRPRDAVAEILVGRELGHVTFHEVDKLHGFSTTVATHADNAKSQGAGVTSRTMAMTTLATLARQHGLAAPDFLKIDVEGAEAEVLAGNDWQACRPKVLVIEAVEPGSMADAWDGWEPFVLEQGYSFAHFDGLNRFYVAQEHAGLAARFPIERSPWEATTHLWDHGRAPHNPGHADHALAMRLVESFMAKLPMLSAADLRGLLILEDDAARLSDAPQPGDHARLLALLHGNGTLLDIAAGHDGRDAPTLAAMYAAVMDDDRFRAALGRIACFYDGGHLMD